MRAARCPFVLLLALLAASPAAAQSSGLAPAAQQKLMGLLLAYEHQPTAQEFTSLGEAAKVRDTLIGIAQNGEQPELLRGRAVFALAFFPDDTTRAAVGGLLDHPELSDIILRRALETMARAFGQRGLAPITPYLDDERSAVREQAARALGIIGTPEALRALRRRLDHETTDAVRTALQEEIARLERPAAGE